MASKDIFLPSDQPGKQVKVVIKEIYKHTAACNACRTRKRKCDGKAPCSYCVAKGQPCQFTQQKKRGPPRKQEELAVSTAFQTGAATTERQMFDYAEAKAFVDYYWGFIKHRVADDSPAAILAPQSVANKIQAYSTLAFAARICGNGSKAATYISQARALSGSVFDNPHPDSVSALFMMSHYWQLVLDLPLARFYSDIAIGLARMTRLDGKLAIFCKIGEIFFNEHSSRRQQSELVKRELKKFAQLNQFTCPFIFAAADILAVFGFNILFPEEASIKKFLHVTDDLHISEEDRMRINESLNSVRLRASMNAQTVGDILFYEMFCSLYQAISEWRSGHPIEAMVYAKTCLNGILQLNSYNQVGIASDFPHVCMLGCLCKLFYEQGDRLAVIQTCQFIRQVCKIMQPEFDFVKAIIDDFMAMQDLHELPEIVTSLGSLPASPHSPTSPISPVPQNASPRSPSSPVTQQTVPDSSISHFHSNSNSPAHQAYLNQIQQALTPQIPAPLMPAHSQSLFTTSLPTTLTNPFLAATTLSVIHNLSAINDGPIPQQGSNFLYVPNGEANNTNTANGENSGGMPYSLVESILNGDNNIPFDHPLIDM